MPYFVYPLFFFIFTNCICTFNKKNIMKPTLLLFAALFFVVATPSYGQNGPTIQFFRIGSIPAATSSYNKQPLMNSNATYNDIITYPEVVSMATNCKTAQFTISIQPVGLALFGPFTETGSKLSAKEIAYIKSLQSGGTAATITIDGIQTDCGGKTTPVVGALIYNCK
jgi:hypothetical protein